MTAQTTTSTRVTGLLRTCHLGPTVAVTTLSFLIAVAVGLGPGKTLLVTLAVLSGQLSIGWSNDLIDAARDRRVGRRDKPLATGVISESTVRVACGVALFASVPLCLACGLVAGLFGLIVIAAGWAYNLGLKSTALSPVPYAVAFGSLPVFVELTGTPGVVPPLWMPLAGALLGVGAHIVNVLPDLAADAATGVRGLPHRLGDRWAPPVAVSVLAGATLIIVVGSSLPWAVAAPGLLAVGGLGAVALLGAGASPFRAAVGIALVDVLMLVGAR